ncbi:MAG: hypothetical protein ABH873_10110 [Candidatus Firestonebacteria bacterium]
MLNEKGIHTFVCSNSWLDVGYGAWLQKFFINHAHIRLIIDNLVKRSFAEADINTIISVIDAPAKKVSDDSITKFVAFKKPFEQSIFTENLLAIEQVKEERNITEDFKVVCKTNKQLLEEGTEYDKDEEHKTVNGFNTYVGNKWGGIYLRAPEIYFKILEKGKGKLVRLGDIADKTQRNNLQSFDKIVEIDENYLINGNYPYLSSVKDISTIKVNTRKLPKSIKKTTKENKTYLIPDLISNRFLGEKLYFIEGGDFLIGDTFFVIKLNSKYSKKEVVLSLNSTCSLFLIELIGRRNLGGGLLTIYGPELMNISLVNPQTISFKQINKFDLIYKNLAYREIKPIFEECGIDPEKNIRDQIPKPKPDRKELDDIIFDIIGLTKDERNEVYWSVCELVQSRLSKAGSV